jgi:4-amino-4-deoxy-L-arabinose transferase-like glycosyltransferase
MFGFISGAVNNDNGVNAACAGLLLLMLIAIRRGLTVPLGVLTGLLLGLAPLFKGTAYAFYPVAAVAAVVLLSDRRRRQRPAPYLAALASFGAVLLAWSLLAPGFGRDVYTTPGGGAPVGSSSIPLRYPTAFLSYLWQTFLPKLPFMQNLQTGEWPFFHIYVERVWGAFGWIALLFQRWVYVVCLAAMAAVAVLLGVAAVREHRPLLARWREAVLVLAVIVAVVAGVEAQFTTLPPPRPTIAEQGRYVFTGLAAFSACAVLACFALGRRRVAPVLAVLVTATVGLSVASQLFVLANTFA